jgi:hypothetical protein
MNDLEADAHVAAINRLKLLSPDFNLLSPNAAVAFAETVDDARYLLMRLVRYVVSWACWATMIVSTFVAFCSLIACLGLWGHEDFDGWRGMMMAHPFAFLFSSVISVLVFLALYVAIATPYRYQTTKPGLNARTCGTCGVQGPDLWRCGNCQGFRVAKVFSGIIWLLGLALTIVTYVLDIGIILFSMFTGIGKK